jgi:hypothetical protein
VLRCSLRWGSVVAAQLFRSRLSPFFEYALVGSGKVKATLPSALDSEHQRMLDELKLKNGKDFDRSYDAVQLKAHQESRAHYLMSGCSPSSLGVSYETSPDRCRQTPAGCFVRSTPRSGCARLTRNVALGRRFREILPIFVNIRCVGSASALGRDVRVHHGCSDSGIRTVIATGIANTQSAAIIQNAIPPKCW